VPNHDDEVSESDMTIRQTAILIASVSALVSGPLAIAQELEEEAEKILLAIGTVLEKCPRTMEPEQRSECVAKALPDGFCPESISESKRRECFQLWLDLANALDSRSDASSD